MDSPSTAPPSEPLEEAATLKKQRDVFRDQFLRIQENYETKIQELSILTELSNALRTTNFQDKETFFTQQLTIVDKYKKPDNISLMIFNEEVQSLKLAAAIKAVDIASLPRFLTVPEGPIAQAYARGSAVQIDALKDDPYFQENHPGEAGSLLCIPLQHNRKAIGVLNLHCKTEDAFSQGHARFFVLVADQISTAVIIFRFYHQMLREEKQRLQLSRFFSKSVVQTILGSEGTLKLGGERKKVTVLFADLRGFTTMSEIMDQKTVVELLNAYFTRMTPIIFQHNGTLDKIMGDGLLALFGAPISYDDDSLQAVRTAIELIKALDDFNHKIEKTGMPRLDLSIGINAGEAVAGYIGSEDHLNYTVIGDTVNTAHRLQSIAGYNEILISRSVLDDCGDGIWEIGDLVSIEAIPPLKLKGKETLMEAYRLNISR